MRYPSLVSPVNHYVDFGYQVLFQGQRSGVRLALGVLLFAISIRRFARLAR
jgi:hypothetical protein